jgi:hypothetical protein
MKEQKQEGGEPSSGATFKNDGRPVEEMAISRSLFF